MRWLDYVRNDLWTEDLRTCSIPRRLAVSALRILLHAGSAFTSDVGPMRPAALTMVTLLSLVPMLAIVSSIADALGYQEHLQSFIDANTAELPENIRDGISEVRGSVARANFRALGLISTGVLTWTILTLFIRVEVALNFTWKTRRRRPWLRRISDFVALIVLFPVLAIVALVGHSLITGAGWSLWMQEHSFFGPLYKAGLGSLTHVVMWCAMTALFRFMPSAHVRWTWAFLGGIVAGSGWLFAHQVWIDLQIGIARANAIYATAAAFPLLIVYLQTVWTIVLFGAEVSYAGQHVHVLGPGNTLRRPSQALGERLALALVERVAARFQGGGGPTDLGAAAGDLDVPREWVEDVCDPLVEARILAFVEGDAGSVLPARPVESLHLHEILVALRGQIDDRDAQRIPLSHATSDRLDEVEENLREALGISPLSTPRADEPTRVALPDDSQTQVDRDVDLVEEHRT